jgi:hypothetical protein
MEPLKVSETGQKGNKGISFTPRGEYVMLTFDYKVLAKAGILARA